MGALVARPEKQAIYQRSILDITNGNAMARSAS